MKDYGGAAFPVLDASLSGLSNRDPGMSLRDYFAAKAMQGILSHPETSLELTPKDISSESYLISDAMIEARKQ